jgi:hypothetical protein
MTIAFMGRLRDEQDARLEEAATAEGMPERREAEQDTEMASEIAARLEYLRGLIEAECISYGEIAELESLAAHIDSADVLLLQWAGVPEFNEESL